MSIEIRRTPNGHDLECDWGIFNLAEPRPERGEVGDLMLALVEYVDRLVKEGPLPSIHDSRVMHSVTRAGDVWEAHCDFLGRRYSWVLHPAHWWDHDGPEVYVGRRVGL